MPGNKEIIGIVLLVEPDKHLSELCRGTVADREKLPVLRGCMIRGENCEDGSLRGTVTDPEDVSILIAEFAGNYGRNNIYPSIDMALQGRKPCIT